MHTDKQLINCLVVDDEPMAQEVLTTHMAQIPALNLVQVCNNAMEAFEALHKNKVDLIFLDINMPVISGLNFLSSLKDPPAIIFTTAYTEYAIEGFEMDAVDYLLKPISFARFSRAVNKAIAKLSANNTPAINIEVAPAAPSASADEKDYMFVKADSKLVKVNYADVRYIEGMKDYLKIHLSAGQPVIVHHTMKGMEDLLPGNRFIRIHKSYIVSLSAIKAIEGNLVHIDKTELPVGSTYRDALFSAISLR